ncbi:mediator complex, subunit Med22 [Lineolata rhizophorae]|uniref:Mediator complex, subunit Med22 n=1 Tax=Lineolata rhizophorae TaxID=578093 RepID=A0A6A6NXC1_9PEZI|nr:mediator complex, subunit Med22 [Lineolata rhizophorae]
MDTSLRSKAALDARINKLTKGLVEKFENMIALAAIESTDSLSTAQVAFQLEVETAALVRIAEDVLALTRQMQEMWLFGKLKTVGQSEAEKRTEENARVVTELLRKLTEERDVVSQGQVGGS